MDTEKTADAGTGTPAEPEEVKTQETPAEPEVPKDMKGLETELAKTRVEAKERRLKIKELEEKLSVFEAEKEAERLKEMKAKGKYEELISELQKKLNEYEPLAVKFIDYEKNKKEAIKKSLEDKELWTESFNKLDLAELEALTEKLIKKTPPANPTDTSSKFGNNNQNDERDPYEKLAGIYN